MAVSANCALDQSMVADVMSNNRFVIIVEWF
ncbi:Uncharacterised protein [Segatella copri]|jgi:hypothetical protein|nr:Uncharacterised protein [Segatella copri]